MPGRIAGFRGRCRAGIVALTLLATLALALPAIAAACGEEGPEDTGPLINFAHLTPGGFPYEDGTAVVTAEVEDDCQVAPNYQEWAVGYQVMVDFSPAFRGFKVGSVIVSRADGAQPNISVTLTGKGVSPTS